MTLPNSGVITLEDIQAEFGGPTNPISLFNYYRGGTYVPDSAANAGVPTSGEISLFDFYGAQAVVISISGFSNSTNGLGGPAFASWGMNTNGNSQNTQNPAGPGSSPPWIDPVGTDVGDDYEVRATVQSGDTPSGIIGVFVSLSSNRVWAQSADGGSENNSCSLLLEVRSAGSTTVLGSGTVSIGAVSTF